LDWLRFTTDALAFSSLWLAAAAASLVAAVAGALGGPVPLGLPGLAFCGTLVIYNVDRLRDLERDRDTAPLRSAFVERHRSVLVAATGVAGVLAAPLAWIAGPRAIALLVPAAALGLAHRRLKSFAFAKPIYIAATWLLVVVGLPWVTLRPDSGGPWCLALVGPAILANAIASNVRDDEAGASVIGRVRALGIARAVTAAGLLLAVVAPDPVRLLGAVPLATGLALVRFRPTERYGFVVVDGALLAGAWIALGLLGALGP
jgi:hypothetical protein